MRVPMAKVRLLDKSGNREILLMLNSRTLYMLLWPHLALHVCPEERPP
jgi:hypothetical protein